MCRPASLLRALALNLAVVGALAAQPATLLDRAVAEVGLQPGALGMDEAELKLWGRGRWRLGVHELFFDDARRIGPHLSRMAERLAGAPEELSRAVLFAHSRTDARVRVGLTGDPFADERARVASLGPLALATAIGEITGRPAAAYLSPAHDDVPWIVREAAALFLLATPRVIADRDAALAGLLDVDRRLPEATWREALDLVIGAELQEGDRLDELAVAERVEALVDEVDRVRLNRGAMTAALLFEEVLALLETEAAALSLRAFRYEVETPLGRVALVGAGRHRLDATDYLLVIDTGGDDVHRTAGATRSAANPLSVVIDLEGDDRYLDEQGQSPSVGAGVFGTGIVVDRRGDDTYVDGACGQGFGLFGTGALLDLGGNDTYEGRAAVQGSGWFGSGLLVDAAGADVYRTWRYAQGFGYTLGCGLLVDGAGDDEYLADDSEFLYASPLYGPDHNLNFSQGCSYGRRGDYTDGHSWAGGFGFLVDGGGDDTYRCGIYGQGSAYWYGVGALVDRGGDDAYRSHQYSTGAAPHYAIGAVVDEAGDDTWTCTRRQCLGHGRDFSIGWLEDRGGDDRYNAPTASLGQANVNSIGIAWDHAGDDTYVQQGFGLGQSRSDSTGSLRDFSLSIGVFLDGGGRDRYLSFPIGERGELEGYLFEGDLETLPAVDFAGDGRTWRREDRPGLQRSHAIGRDVPSDR